MKKTQIVTTVTCDICKRKLDSDHLGYHYDMHFCEDCCRELELYIKKLLYQEVPDKRGGFRKLGHYDG